MAENCQVSGGSVMILSCSGCSNVGQIANQCAVELTKEGFGKMACLSKIGARAAGAAQSARDASEMLAIDGCSVGCTKSILEQADVPLRGYLVLTELGIEKNKDLNLKQGDIDRAKEAARQAWSRPQPKAPEEKPRCCCG